MGGGGTREGRGWEAIEERAGDGSSKRVKSGVDRRKSPGGTSL